MKTFSAIITSVVTFILLGVANMVLEFFGISIKDKFLVWRKKQYMRRKDPKNLNPHIIKYYKKHNQEDILYTIEFKSTKKQIPFITKNSWINNHNGNINFVLSNPVRFSNVKEDLKLIKKFQSENHKIWNSDTFSLVKIIENQDGIILELGICSYYQYFTISHKLRQETINGGKKLRNKYLSSIDKISALPMGAYGIGTACLVAIKEGTDYSFLLQSRSDKTISHGKQIAAIPCFAFQPVSTNYQTETDFKNQIIREFYEELYNKKDLVQNKHLTSDWFHDEPTVNKFRNLIENKSIEIIQLGFGFDALNGEPIVAFLMIIKDEGYWNTEYKNIQINWEADKIFKIKYNDPYFENLLKCENYHYGSMFAISESVRYLDKLERSLLPT